jgi:serine/threonine protein kinase/WD40 repeat protein
MNASRHLEMFRAAAAADPLASLRMDATAIADLAFGSMSVDVTAVEGRHLAMLSTEALELDLDDPAQRQFGDYELLELIGEGGMGVVYRAHQTSLDRDVAVKLLAAGPWASKSFIERFRHEAQNAARMQHPNIVAIYEVGCSQELHFFSMRLIRGGSLADLIKDKGKLDPRDAARLLRTIAEAVDYAHKLGVLHLDLKPANVLLDDNGNPHVADFGLARRLEQGLATDTTEVSGTPSYMAPEQCVAAQKVTPATDIWGLGAVLYELTTGRPPYLGKTPQETLKLVVEGKLVCPGTYVKDLPPDLKAIIRKAIAYDVADRYATARDLADDLARFENGYMVKARPLNTLQRSARWARREPKVVVSTLLALLALLVGLVAATVQWRRAETQRHLAQKQTQLAQKNESTSYARLWESRRTTALRLQADGKAFEALPALVANIEEREKVGMSAAVERREAGMILHQGVTLIDRMIIADAKPLATALSQDGSVLAVGLDDISVRWFDTATLTERGRMDLLDQPTSDGTPRAPRLLRFADDHHLLVTLDWFDYFISPPNLDTILVDLDRQQVISPPAQFADFATAYYSADAHHALLFNRSGSGQFWQVDPWQPVSAAEFLAFGTDVEPWIVAKGGRQLIHPASSQDGLKITDAHRPRVNHVFDSLNDKRITAWQESHDGGLVAAGDDQGRIYIIDTKRAAVRALPIPSGSYVTWLAFSEDDAWVAATRHEGDAFAFDVATGDTLHSGLLQHDFEPRHVQLSHAERLMIVSGAGDVALWHLPAGQLGGRTATRIAANPTRSARAGLFWADASLEAGLLATADMDGEVRLWRLPLNPELDALAPNRFALSFDGRHTADNSANRIRLTSIDRRESSPWAALPEPPVFTALVDSGRTAVVVAGRALHVFDPATMLPRHAPTELIDTPNNASFRTDGTLAVLAFGRNNATGYKLHLQAFDPATGRQLPGEAIVEGPIRQMDFSRDGKRLLVVGPLRGATEVFDSATLERVGAYPHAPEQPVSSATFAPSAEDVWLLETALDESETDSGRLLRWQPKTNRVLEQRVLSGAKPFGVSTLGRQPLVFTRDGFTLDPGAPDMHAGPTLRGGEATWTFATTTDQQVIAHAHSHNVQLYDASTFDAVGPPLFLNWSGDDVIANLSVDPTGEHLAAVLGVSSRQFVWAIGSDTRPPEDLRRDAELLTLAERTGRVLRMPDAAEQARLRARDPGAWHPHEPRPPMVAARYIDGVPVLPRSPRAGPLQLDLTDRYTVGSYNPLGSMDTVLVSITSLPLGLATLEGVDYDIRGGIELRFQQPADGRTHDRRLRSSAAGIRVPSVPIAALHVLMLATLPTPELTERTYARIRLHYHDGGEALLPIRIQREIPGLSTDDQPTPVGWGDAGLAVVGVLPIRLYSNPRLANPHPERIIASLDLETGDGWAEPVFVAITAEPVIAAEKSGSTEVREGVK